MEYIVGVLAFIAGVVIGHVIGSQRERRANVDLLLNDMGMSLEEWRTKRSASKKEQSNAK